MRLVAELLSRYISAGVMLVSVGLGVLVGLPALSYDHPSPEVRQVTRFYTDADRLVAALEILSRVPTGLTLLKAARTQWNIQDRHNLVSVFQWSKVSRTDAVVVRKFSPATGSETKERQVTVYLRAGQALPDLVLDIAHELTHATSSPSWDPYDPDLTASRYIWAAIEGPGGEVDALIGECQVAAELSLKLGISAVRCNRYQQASTIALRKDTVRRDFYRVGHWQERLAAQLGNEVLKFPLLSSDPPLLYSSTGQAPYPIALFQEFQEITEIACDNSRKRLAYNAEALKTSAARFLSLRCPYAKGSRAPAAAPLR